MGERFVDYFELGELEPDDSRQENYDRLVEAHREAAKKRGTRGRTDAALLTEAMEIFRDEDKYARYRAMWERRQHKDEEPEREATREPEARAEPMGTSQKDSFLSVLGSAALKGLQSYLETKQSQQPDQTERLPQSDRVTSSSLTGVWRDGGGNTFQVEQSGNVIAVQGRDIFGNVVLDGRGVLTGRVIQYEARNAMGQTGRGVFKVSRNGQVIEGQVAWWHFNAPVGAARIRLVRS
jgi:hypothetical protein